MVDVEGNEDLINFLLQDPEPADAEEESFEPNEFVWMVDRFFTQIWGRKFGFLMGVLYTFVTYGFAIGIWFGVSYILTFTNYFTNGLNLSLLSITIGSFVIMTGSNLVNHFDEENLDFKAYVHNSVTFISSGIALLGGYIFRTLVENQQMPVFFDSVIMIITLGLNFIGGFLLMVSLWVILKLLWRLNQLTTWKKDYGYTKSTYSEFRATIAGAKAGFKSAESSEIGILGSIMGGIVWLALFAIPYAFTGELFWSGLLFVIVSGFSILGMLIRDEIPQRNRYQQIQSLILMIVLIASPYYLERNIFLSFVVLAVYIISNGIRLIKSE